MQTIINYEIELDGADGLSKPRERAGISLVDKERGDTLLSKRIFRSTSAPNIWARGRNSRNARSDAPSFPSNPMLETTWELLVPSPDFQYGSD